MGSRSGDPGDGALAARGVRNAMLSQPMERLTMWSEGVSRDGVQALAMEEYLRLWAPHPAT